MKDSYDEYSKSRFFARITPLRVVSLLIVAMFIGTIFLTGCTKNNTTTHIGAGATSATPIAASGKLVDKELSYSNFSKLEINSAIKYDIVRADDYKVVITVDDNIAEYLNTSQDGQTVKLGLKDGAYLNMTVKAKISMPRLDLLVASSASEGTLNGFKSAESMELSLSGASKVSGRVDTGDIKLTLSGASTATLSGTGANAKMDISGASNAQLKDMTVNDVTAVVFGASTATANIKGKLDATATGASKFYYGGTPQLGKVQATDSSQVKHQ